MYQSFGKCIRDLRVRKNLTQRALALQVGVSHTYLSKLELCRLDSPSANLIHRLAEALDANEYQLFDLAGRIPEGLGRMMEGSSLLTELVRVLSERVLSDATYLQLLHLAYREARKVE